MAVRSTPPCERHLQRHRGCQGVMTRVLRGAEGCPRVPRARRRRRHGSNREAHRCAALCSTAQPTTDGAAGHVRRTHEASARPRASPRRRRVCRTASVSAAPRAPHRAACQDENMLAERPCLLSLQDARARVCACARGRGRGGRSGVRGALGHLARPRNEGAAQLARRAPCERRHVGDTAWHVHKLHVCMGRAWPLWHSLRA